MMQALKGLDKFLSQGFILAIRPGLRSFYSESFSMEEADNSLVAAFNLICIADIPMKGFCSPECPVRFSRIFNQGGKFSGLFSADDGGSPRSFVYAMPSTPE